MNRVCNLCKASGVGVTVGAMATIGYARVSTREQNPDGQTDLLGAAGCEKIFVEHASGTLANRRQ